MSADHEHGTQEEKTIELPFAQTDLEEKTSTIGSEEQKPLPKWRIHPMRISAAFIIPGVLSLGVSVLKDSQALAFIGLGLTFWGALFLFMKPATYVEASVLESTAISTYTLIDRAMKELKQKTKAYYIPSYPEEGFVPDHLKGLKDTVVFVPAETGGILPSIEQMAAGKFNVLNPKGICLTPPGLELLARIERETRKETSKLEFDEFCETLPAIILGSLQLAKGIEIKNEVGQVTLKLTDSIYKNLYTNQQIRSVHVIGCPLVSAIACAISKTTGKIVTIQKDLVSPDKDTIMISYCIMEAQT
jgi:hypothetical protein